MKDIKIFFLRKKVWRIIYPKNYHITLYEYDLKDQIDKDENGHACNITYHYYLDKKINENIKMYVKKGKVTHTKFDGKVIIEKEN